MTVEGRQPQSVQDAVEATLRRLRREVGGRRPAERIEPQFTMPTAASAGPIAAEASAEPSRPAALAEEEPPEDPVAEPELANISISEPDIPPIPPPFGRVPHVAAEEDPRGVPQLRRPWLRYIAALVLIFVAAPGGWGGYRQLAGRTSNGQVPVIPADQTPEKVPPA